MRFSGRTAVEVAVALLVLIGTALATWAQSQFCVSPNLPIPDASSGGVDSDLVIVRDFTFSDMDVTIVAQHTWPGDLIVTLSKVSGPDSPAGPATIMERPGVPTSNFGCSVDNVSTVLYDSSPVSVNTVCRPTPPGVDHGPYHPAPDNLSTFLPIATMGTWRLHVRDFAAGDTGTLVLWCMSAGTIPVELMHFSIE